MSKGIRQVISEIPFKNILEFYSNPNLSHSKSPTFNEFNYEVD